MNVLTPVNRLFRITLAQHRLWEPRTTLSRFFHKEISMAQNKLQVGDRAPDGLVIAIDDAEQPLAELWADGPILLTFLRHFG